MSINSSSIESIISKIKKFRSLYEQNEMAVRDQIINPTLKILGWNPEDPEEIRPNISVEEGIPDYSLYRNEKIILFIEAKKMSIDIEQKDVIKQLAKYSFSEGTKYGVITNGTIWILIKSFEEGTTLNDRIVWKVDLENDELNEAHRKLNTISKNEIDSIELLNKKIQILDEIWQSLIEEPDDMVKGLMNVVKQLLEEGYKEINFNDNEIEDLLKSRILDLISNYSYENTDTSVLSDNETNFESNSIPRKMTLKNESFELRYSFEILINTANWLIKNGKLKPSDCPVGVGRGKRFLINKEPKHKYGESFRAPKKLSNNLWIETHASTASIITYTKRLLEKFSFSPNILTLT